MDERDTGDEHVRTCAKVLAVLRVGRVLKKGARPLLNPPLQWLLKFASL